MVVVMVTICNPFRSLVVVVMVAVQTSVVVDDTDLTTPFTSVPSFPTRNRFTNFPFLTSAVIFSPVESA